MAITQHVTHAKKGIFLPIEQASRLQDAIAAWAIKPSISLQRTVQKQLASDVKTDWSSLLARRLKSLLPTPLLLIQGSVPLN